MKLRDEILSRKQVAEDYLRTKRILWDSAEQLFHNQINDSISDNTKSQVFDPKLSTLVLERGYRVMSQLPVGKVKPISKNDIGTTKLMNLVVDKYVIPNANAQFDFLTKLRMIDIYSNVYGNFFALIDWDVRKNGYVGPDMWLLNIRDVFPQVGAVSLDDSDYCIVRTWKPLSYFENLKKQDGFKNVPAILAKLKDKTGSKQARSSGTSISEREINQYPTSQSAKNRGYFEVLTQFEKDRWVDFCVDADMDFRDQKNPHDNDELPLVAKYSIPLLDDFMGMGDMERGKTMQMTINSIWNLYLDAVKISIFPPVLVNKDNIASMSSIKWGAAEKWLVRNQINNAVTPVNLTPRGIDTFNTVYRVATTSILNMFGTSDTAVTQETDSGFGKTPAALRMLQTRENTRDNADRFYMEQFLSKVMKKMVNLISKKQSSAITVRLFEEEIKELERSYPEIKEFYDEKTGKLSVSKKITGSTMYDYEIVSGSTYAVDQKEQQQFMTVLFELWKSSQTPDGRNFLTETLKQDGYNFKFGELFKRLVSMGGIQDWDKILEEMTEEEKAAMILQRTNDQFQQALMQMTGNVNQTPPQPDGQMQLKQGQPVQQPQQPGMLG